MVDALHVDKGEWQAELPLIDEWFTKIGEKLPKEMGVELVKLRSNLN
jgi:phosphoenolpyruvate carboxykinase (GTP)